MRVLRAPGDNQRADCGGETVTEDSMKPYVIVAIVHSVGDRQYVSEEEARIDAMERAEQTGHSYKVMKVCGTAVCHKKAELKEIEP
jgi:hypothetical protein